MGFFVCEIDYRFTCKNTYLKMIMYGLTCNLILWITVYSAVINRGLVLVEQFRTFVRKNVKYFMYVCIILAIKEWADLFRGDVDIGRLILNTFLAFYFWGLSAGKFEFRE